MKFNIVPDFLKPQIFYEMIQFCEEKKMLEFILPQLDAIDLIADKYKFSDEDRNMIFESAICSLKKSVDSSKELNTLYRILLKRVKDTENLSTIPDKVILLYQLSIQLYSVSQYNSLLEMKAYSVLKTASPQMEELVQIFAMKGLKEYYEWEKKSEEFIKERNMSKDQLRKKLSMMLLCEMHIGNTEGKITYKDIRGAINVCI